MVELSQLVWLSQFAELNYSLLLPDKMALVAGFAGNTKMCKIYKEFK